MSASALVTIFCDEPSCGHWDGAGIAETARQARSGLRGGGWTLAVTNPDGGPTQDFCPKHTPTASNQEK